MKEQERLRNRQIELENLRNKHSKSQFDHRKSTNRSSKKLEQDDFNDDEENNANDSNEPSEDYYYQTLYQNNGTVQLNNGLTQNQLYHGANSRINNNNNRSSRLFNDKTQIKIVDDYDDTSEYVDGAEIRNKSRNNGSNLK